MQPIHARLIPRGIGAEKGPTMKERAEPRAQEAYFDTWRIAPKDLHTLIPNPSAGLSPAFQEARRCSSDC